MVVLFIGWVLNTAREIQHSEFGLGKQDCPVSVLVEYYNAIMHFQMKLRFSPRNATNWPVIGVNYDAEINY